MRGVDLDPAAAGVALRLLDGFDLTSDEVSVPLAHGSQRLVAFVALRQHPVLRCFAIGRLWPERSERCGQASLRTELHRLRTKCPVQIVRTTRSHLALAPDVAVDVRAQLAAIDEVNAPAPGTIDHAVARLSGELLPGWYDEWLVVEREQLRNRRLHALEVLSARLSREGRHGAAVEAGLAALAADPLRETAHRAVIEALLAEGNRAEALRQWRTYRRLIHERFRLEPAFSWDEFVTRSHGTLTAA